ncbi:hypothetical protein EDD11_010120 [Mortierella claussenii]|nr:hypothetical protein EDD11_010120 [Mortierella claussenii]
MLISYEHVRKAVYRQHMNNAQKVSNVMQSVRLWMDQVIQEGGKSKFEEQINDNSNSFLIAWSTSFQLKDNETIACMDSTHRTVKSINPSATNDKAYASAYLFTILIKDRNVQRGIPVAFMICGSESSYNVVDLAQN